MSRFTLMLKFLLSPKVVLCLVCSLIGGPFYFFNMLFLELHSTTQTLTIHTHIHPCEHMYANPTPMSTSKGLSRQISRFTKSSLAPRCRQGRRLPLKAYIAPLNPRINPEKYEHPCQVEDLNPGGQVPPQET
jgi:hypothetical protein